MPIETLAPDAGELIPELRRLLLEWLPRQRWFDASDDDIGDLTVIRTETIRREWPMVLWVPLEVMIDDAPMICQAVLALGAVVPADVPLAAVVGEISIGEESVMVYEALASPQTAAAFVSHVSGGLASSSPDRVVDSPWMTTVQLPQQRELTLYRRLQAGPHPDVELTSALAAAHVGVVRPPAAVWRKNRHDLATLRRNVRRGSDGAELARASVDELLRRRCQPNRNPLDLADDANRLGRAVADLHVALGDRLGVTDGDGDTLVRTLEARLPHRLDPAVADRVAAAYRRLSHADDLGSFIRIHGNLDLRSVERTRGGWVMTRFGCNPDSALMFEHLPLSPLCDLAPLLHGFATTAAASQAAAAAEAASDVVPARPGDGDRDAPPDLGRRERARELAVLAEAWEERCADALIAGYTSNEAVQRLLPVERISRDALLTLFELELAVRDAVRAGAADPGVVRIPLSDVTDLAAGVRRLSW